MKFLPTLLGVLCGSISGMQSKPLTLVQKMIVNEGTIIYQRSIDTAGIYAYPLIDIMNKFRKDYGVSQKAATVLEIELKTFLIDAAYSKVGLPYRRKKVNQLWHTFILHTREYHLFCFTFFGRMIHHHPNMFDDVKPCLQLEDSDEEDRSRLLAYSALYNED